MKGAQARATKALLALGPVLKETLPPGRAASRLGLAG